MKVTERSSFGELEVLVLHDLVSWLYNKKDVTWDEFLNLSQVQQSSLVAEFNNLKEG